MAAVNPPGLYRTSAAPGSTVVRAELRNAAWPCRVAQLRYDGIYLPADLILSHHLFTGWIISTDMGPGEWESTLYTSIKDERSLINPLTEIRTVRQRGDGIYLLQGTAWDAGYLQRRPQDWICGPVDESESVMAAVREIDGWLKQRYIGAYRMGQS